MGDVTFSINQLNAARKYLRGDSPLCDARLAILSCIYHLMRLIKKQNREAISMDKKMHKITERMKTAGKDIKSNKPKAASKALKGAEKANEKLVKIDKTKRDPIIKAYNKAMSRMQVNTKGNSNSNSKSKSKGKR